MEPSVRRKLTPGPASSWNVTSTKLTNSSPFGQKEGDWTVGKDTPIPPSPPPSWTSNQARGHRATRTKRQTVELPHSAKPLPRRASWIPTTACGPHAGTHRVRQITLQKMKSHWHLRKPCMRPLSLYPPPWLFTQYSCKSHS